MPESGSKKQIDLKFAYFGQLFAEFSSLPREIQQRVQEVLPPTVQALVQEYAKKGVLPKERLDGLKWAELATCRREGARGHLHPWADDISAIDRIPERDDLDGFDRADYVAS